MAAYIIVKGSRLKDYYTIFDAYKGPTCQAAGVPAGWVYTDRNLASQHAQLLTKFNPVGFVVVDVGLSSSTGVYTFNESGSVKDEDYE